MNRDIQQETKARSRQPFSHWLRVCRPLAYWLVLVLALFLYHTHELLLARTVLLFSAHTEGDSLPFSNIEATLDGKRIFSEQRIPLGNHVFSLHLPKLRPFSTNMFIWYGIHDLGTIRLKRTAGTLSMNITPPALLTISGPDFNKVLPACYGLTSSIPADAYEVKASWANFEQSETFIVYDNQETTRKFCPALGALQIETIPPGAQFILNNGKDMGRTPIIAVEVPAARVFGELRLNGYLTVPVDLTISANQTNTFTTNLVNWRYTQAIESATNGFARGDFESALYALNAALAAVPDDETALTLQRRIRTSQHLYQAQLAFREGKFQAAEEQAHLALDFDPQASEAQTILDEISKQRKGSAEELERQRRRAAVQKVLKERTDLIQGYLETICNRYLDSDLFQENNMMCERPVENLDPAICGALSNREPRFVVERNDWVETNVFVIEAKQGVSGGFRRAMIVGGALSGDESKVVFKVLEYEVHEKDLLGGFVKLSDGQPPLVAVHRSRVKEMTNDKENRVAQGINSISDRLKSSAR